MRSIKIVVVGVVCLLPQLGISQTRPAQELRLSAPCGILRITAQAENALRVRCGGAAANQEPELIFTTSRESTRLSVGSDGRSSWLQTGQITAVVDKKTGDIRFLDAKGKLLTQEVPGGRTLTQASDSEAQLKTA